MKKGSKEPWMNNREQVRAPRLGKGWCLCDYYIVANCQKCPGCGRVNGRKRNKK